MSRCRFPHLTHLDIHIANPAADHDGMPHICRFVDAHRDIRSLRIDLRDDWYASIVPFVRAPTLRIRCGPSRHCPPPAFVPLLRPEVKTLELEFSSLTWEHTKHALTWELLKQFAAEGDTLPTLETIRLSATDMDGKLKPTTDEKFLCTLRSHVFTLNERGIRVFVDDIQM
jgi:hypothetical protein